MIKRLLCRLLIVINRKSSNSTDNLIKEPEYAYERKFKLKPLAFKQNIEIQRLIDVFKDNSDDDIDELNSGILLLINSNRICSKNHIPWTKFGFIKETSRR